MTSNIFFFFFFGITILLITLKTEEKNLFSAYYALGFQKGKNATKMKNKDLCSVWRRYCDVLNVSKMVCDIHVEIFCWMILHG